MSNWVMCNKLFKKNIWKGQHFQKSKHKILLNFKRKIKIRYTFLFHIE